MVRYIGKRFVISLITIWILATLTFFLIRLLPGDPFTSEKITPEIKANMMKYYGLDKPLPVQYATYMGNLLKGDMGYSLRYKNREVNNIIADAFPASADLGLRSLVFSVILGLILGIVAALNHNKFWDYACMVIAVIGVSVPSFVVGSLIQYLFGIKWKLLPVAQWKSFAHTIMPTFALGLGTLALIARLMRTSMLEVVGQDYIKTAKAKGLSPAQVTIKHQIRNAILPVVTVLGPLVASLLTGTFVIEQIFAIPGLGRHYVVSIQNLDYTMVMGLTIFFGAFLVLMNFLVDIAYGLVDPRIRVGK
ncbi:ABC transporter permease [Lutispora thermophila]|uniref:Oligopeptide transport system permease protein n=1 Tax=Lutispora thermophila DSM 19022 TaxID=1122184 RepID=A0A1M6AZ06_9FIRM|nr:ABC transporter permease [Lutispora thermophila]SHI41692.1 oligopeptide transport system permease protein [Lutispora thermophila DSM 19022]